MLQRLNKYFPVTDLMDVKRIENILNLLYNHQPYF